MSDAPPVHVMIVEDSATVRGLLEHIVATDPRLKLAASVASGEAALKQLDRARPDVISMDVHLPGIDGLETTRRIMRVRPTPIVVVSSSASVPEARLTIRALQAGALAVMDKPVGIGHCDYERIAGDLCRQLVVMSEIRLVRQRRGFGFAPRHLPPRPPLTSDSVPLRALAVAASTGGPSALETFFNGLPADLPVPVLLVQHITGSFLPGFATWLADATPLRVAIAADGMRPECGTIYLAPADHHLRLMGSLLAIDRGPPISTQRPSANVLFHSVARSARRDAVGVILTGMGDDGAEGLAAMHAAGAYTLAEDESTAVVYGMPKVAVQMGAVRESLPLPQLAPRVRELVAARARGPATPAHGPVTGA